MMKERFFLFAKSDCSLSFSVIFSVSSCGFHLFQPLLTSIDAFYIFVELESQRQLHDFHERPYGVSVLFCFDSFCSWEIISCFCPCLSFLFTDAFRFFFLKLQTVIHKMCSCFTHTQCLNIHLFYSIFQLPIWYKQRQSIRVS